MPKLITNKRSRKETDFVDGADKKKINTVAEEDEKIDNNENDDDDVRDVVTNTEAAAVNSFISPNMLQELQSKIMSRSFEDQSPNLDDNNDAHDILLSGPPWYATDDDQTKISLPPRLSSSYYNVNNNDELADIDDHDHKNDHDHLSLGPPGSLLAPAPTRLSTSTVNLRKKSGDAIEDNLRNTKSLDPKSFSSIISEDETLDKLTLSDKINAMFDDALMDFENVLQNYDQDIESVK